jgi:hypothetical protein
MPGKGKDDIYEPHLVIYLSLGKKMPAGEMCAISESLPER